MKEIQLSKTGKNKGKFIALVDDADYEWLNQYNWNANRSDNTYYATTTNGIKMHRLILGLVKGDKKICDHKDHNGLNNQRINLRVATLSQNMYNKTSQINSSSKYLGVSKFIQHKNTKYCKTYFISKCNKIHLGYFPFTETGEIEAAKAYDTKAKELYGEYANLNFPKLVNC